MLEKIIKNILLISPPAFTSNSMIDINPLPPMGMGYLAAVLRNAGYNVKIVDSLGLGWNNREEIRDDVIKIGLSDEQILQELKNFNPQLVGVSNLFSRQFLNSLNVAKLIKGFDSSIFIVTGGAHPTADPDSVMKHSEFDASIEGEGEIPLLNLVRYLNNELGEDSLEALYKRQSDGSVKYYPRKTWMELDDLPWPAYDLMNLEYYFGLGSSHGMRKNKKFMPVITSRGCPYKCTFCTAAKVWGKKFRTRSEDDVIAEMKFLKNNYGVQEIMFEDDNTTLNVARAKRLFQKMIDEKLDFEWDTPNGVAAFALDNETLDLMKKAGCFKVNLAIESGNQEHLKYNIKKPLKLVKVPPLVEHCKKIGLDVGTFLVFGMPGETEEMVWESVKFCVDMGIYDPMISVATPYPGSELFKMCQENGYLKEDFSLDDLYIRSYSISTPELPAARLEELVNEITIWLKFQKIKHEPIKSAYKALKIVLKEPERIKYWMRIVRSYVGDRLNKKRLVF